MSGVVVVVIVIVVIVLDARSGIEIYEVESESAKWNRNLRDFVIVACGE